jgi:hypothetical protein
MKHINILNHPKHALPWRMRKIGSIWNIEHDMFQIVENRASGFQISFRVIYHRLCVCTTVLGVLLVNDNLHEWLVFKLILRERYYLVRMPAQSQVKSEMAMARLLVQT